MNKSTELSNTQKPANCGYTVLPAVFCQQEEELIANYMGEKATGGYHQSWDWLMPVVEKIESLGAIVEIWLSLGKGCRIYFLKERNEFIHESNSTIEAVFEAVYAFVEWYDKNKKQ